MRITLEILFTCGGVGAWLGMLSVRRQVRKLVARSEGLQVRIDLEIAELQARLDAFAKLARGSSS